MSIAGAAISAGAALLGTAGNIASTGKLNKKNRQWQEDMWNKTNSYNTPAAQMQRFREAGLNPHLIYGTGTNGNATPAAAPAQEAPDFSGIGDAAQSYVATRMQQTQIKQLEKAIEVADTEKSLKQAQEIATLSGAAKTDTENKQLQDLFDLKKTQLEANLNQTNVNTQLTQKSIEKTVQDIAASKAGINLTNAQVAKIAQDISESSQRIKLMKIEGNNKALDSELKQLDINLRRAGINPNDPMWARMIGQFLANDDNKDTDGKWDLKTPIKSGFKKISEAVYNWFTR